MESDRPAPNSPSSSGINTTSEKLLQNAWERHDIYSDNATKAQQRFFFVRRVLAYLSVAVVVLSVTQPVIRYQVENVLLARTRIADSEVSGLGPVRATLIEELSADSTLATATGSSLDTAPSGAESPFEPTVEDAESSGESGTEGEESSVETAAEEIDNTRARVGQLSITALFRLSLDDPLSWFTALTLIDFLLILLPILTTGLLAFAVKFDRGNNWILLRGNSETLKTEIYYYRTRVKQYRQNRNGVLAEKLKLISERIKGSAVHQAALDPYEGQQPTRLKKGLVILVAEWIIQTIRQLVTVIWDTLFQLKEVALPDQSSVDTSDRVKEDTPQEQKNYLKRYADLDADTYIRYRLEDQFDWYRRKSKNYDRNYQTLQTSVYVFGGLGTLLAAIGLQNWVAVSTTLAGAVASYLEYKRVEATLVGYNQAADSLYDIRAWWFALSDDEKAKFVNFEKLVASTEETIRSEHTSWLQDMQDRLANLYGDAGDDDDNDEVAPIDTVSLLSAQATETEADHSPEDDSSEPDSPEAGSSEEPSSGSN